MAAITKQAFHTLAEVCLVPRTHLVLSGRLSPLFATRTLGSAFEWQTTKAMLASLEFFQLLPVR